MSYGISIKNESNYTLIDDTSYPTLFSVTSGENFLATGSALPTYTDLVFARPATVPGTIYYNARNGIVTSTGGFYYRAYRPVNGAGFTVPSTGYGLNVFSSAGSPVFSATSTNFSSNLEIIASARFLDTGGYYVGVEIPITKAEYSISNQKTYILLNSTCGTSGNLGGLVQYFDFASAPGYGKITAYSYVEQYVTEIGEYLGFPVSNGNAIIIGYVR